MLTGRLGVDPIGSSPTGIWLVILPVHRKNFHDLSEPSLQMGRVEDFSRSCHI